MFAVASTLACSTPVEREQDLPTAATFRRGAAVEFYDFSLSVSHAGGDGGVRGRDCSTEAYHCYVGVTVLIAPRRCSALRRSVRSGADWRVDNAVGARFLFVSEQQLYYLSRAADRDMSNVGGFVYDIERGVVGVWRSEAATRTLLDRDAMREIVDSTKWLESPSSLFACRR
jgi:hypothetical protein